MSQKTWPNGKKQGFSMPDQSLYREVMRLFTEVTNMKFKTRVLEAKIFLMESEHDMLVRMLRLPTSVYADNRSRQMVRILDRNKYIKLENLMDNLYNLVQPDGKINAVLTVSRYGEEPSKPEQGNGGGDTKISGAGEPVLDPSGDKC